MPVTILRKVTVSGGTVLRAANNLGDVADATTSWNNLAGGNRTITGNLTVSGTSVVVGASSPSANFPYRAAVDANSTVAGDITNTNAGTGANASWHLVTDAGTNVLRAHSIAHSTWPGKLLLSSPAAGAGVVINTGGAGDPIEFYTNNNLRTTISDTGVTHTGNLTVSGTGTSTFAGVLSVGSTSATSTTSAGVPQIGAESDLYTSINSIAHNNTNGNHGFFFAGKSRGTKAAPIIVADGDVVGEYGFIAFDGAAYRTSARIRGVIAGAPGASDLPTRMEMHVAPDGSATPQSVATFATTGVAIQGTTTNDNAATGYVGEYVSSTLVRTSRIALTTATAANVTSISLTAGDWDVWGSVGFLPNAATTQDRMIAAVGTSSATLPDIGAWQRTDVPLFGATATGGLDRVVNTPVARFSLSATTTVYLISYGEFGTNALEAFGSIKARRAR